MSYDESYAKFKRQTEAALEAFLEEVAVATLKVGKDPLPEGLRSIGTKALKVGKEYFVIPKDPKERV